MAPTGSDSIDSECLGVERGSPVDASGLIIRCRRVETGRDLGFVSQPGDDDDLETVDRREAVRVERRQPAQDDGRIRPPVEPDDVSEPTILAPADLAQPRQECTNLARQDEDDALDRRDDGERRDAEDEPGRWVSEDIAGRDDREVRDEDDDPRRADAVRVRPSARAITRDGSRS